MKRSLSAALSSKEIWILGLSWILFKVINFNSYTTFFSSSDAAGLVSEGPFVVGIACGTIAASLLVGVSVCCGFLKSWKLNYQVPLALLVMVYAFFLVGGTSLSSDISTRLYFFFGIVYSASSVFVALVLLELFVAQQCLSAIALQLAAGKILSSLARLALDAVPPLASQFFCLACLLVCFFCIRYLRVHMAPPSFDASKGWFKRSFNDVYLLYFVAAVMSIVASMIGIFGVSGEANSLISPFVTVLSAFLCGAIFLGMTLGARQLPHPSFAFTVIVPLLLVVMLMVPFFIQTYGLALGTIIYASQSFVSLFAAYTYTETYMKHRTPVYAFAAFIYGTDKVFSLVGLSVGEIVNTFPSQNDFIATSVMSAIAVYFLVFALLVYLHKIRGQEKAALDEVRCRNEALVAAACEIRQLENEALDRKDVFSERIKELSLLYSLTNREEEILEQLAKGRNTTAIGKSLFLSANTVRTYKKGVYAKLDVHSREELLSLFD